MSGSQFNSKPDAARLLAYLRQLKNDRGAMADLRCALSPARRFRAWPLLARVGRIDNPIVETVAGMFAHHPEETNIGNLGTTCRRLTEHHQSFDARFRRLLACDRDEMCKRVRPVALAAKSQGVPVNYQALFLDLYYWDWSDSVKAHWAGEYWGAPEAEEQAAPVVPETAP